MSHWEDGQALVGCPGPEKHSEGGESRPCGCWEAYEGAVGGRGYKANDKAGGVEQRMGAGSAPDSPVSQNLRTGSTASNCVLEKAREVYSRKVAVLSSEAKKATAANDH